MPSVTGAHHIALTVRDAEVSAAWYADLLGMQVVMTVDDDSVRSRVLVDPASGFALAVREPAGRSGDAFNELRTGLDHLSFGVASRDELDAWARELEQRAIVYSPIVELPIGSLLAFRDPDNIQLEFWHDAAS